MNTAIKEINLIPAETRFLLHWTISRVILLMSPALIAGLIVVHMMHERTINNYESRIVKSEIELADLTWQQIEMLEIIGSVEKISERKPELELIRNIVTDYQNTSFIWSSVIADILENTGKGMWFEKLEVYDDNRKQKDKKALSVKKIDIGGRAFSQSSIAGFVGFLESYELFTEIVLVESVREVYGNRTVYRFLVTGEVRK